MPEGPSGQHIRRQRFALGQSIAAVEAFPNLYTYQSLRPCRAEAEAMDYLMLRKGVISIRNTAIPSRSHIQSI